MLFLGTHRRTSEPHRLCRKPVPNPARVPVSFGSLNHRFCASAVFPDTLGTHKNANPRCAATRRCCLASNHGAPSVRQRWFSANAVLVEARESSAHANRRSTGVGNSDFCAKARLPSGRRTSDGREHLFTGAARPGFHGTQVWGLTAGSRFDMTKLFRAPERVRFPEIDPCRVVARSCFDFTSSAG